MRIRIPRFATILLTVTIANLAFSHGVIVRVSQSTEKEGELQYTLASGAKVSFEELSKMFIDFMALSSATGGTRVVIGVEARVEVGKVSEFVELLHKYGYRHLTMIVYWPQEDDLKDDADMILFDDQEVCDKCGGSRLAEHEVRQEIRTKYSARDTEREVYELFRRLKEPLLPEDRLPPSRPDEGSSECEASRDDKGGAAVTNAQTSKTESIQGDRKTDVLPPTGPR